MNDFACSSRESPFFSEPSNNKKKRTRRSRAGLGGAVCVPVSTISERVHAVERLCSRNGAAHPLRAAEQRHWTAALDSPSDPVMLVSNVRGRCFVPALSFLLGKEASGRVLRSSEAMQLLTDVSAADLNPLLRRVGFILCRRRPNDITTHTTATYDQSALRDLLNEGNLYLPPPLPPPWAQVP